MARTAEAHRRQQERKALRLRQTAEAPEWQIWRICDVCQQSYCANNYADHKVRIKKWKGLEVCAYCRIHILKNLPRLMELGILKFTKAYK